MHRFNLKFSTSYAAFVPQLKPSVHQCRYKKVRFALQFIIICLEMLASTVVWLAVVVCGRWIAYL